MIELRDVVVAYDTRVILDSVNLTIEDGETLVILGGSGSGKSTLLRLIIGLQRPTSGQIIVDERLGWVGLSGYESYMPNELSGGMKKRVSLARAIALDPTLILYDEPSSGLDPITSGTISMLIRGMQERLGCTSIVVTHDMQSAFYVADRIALLDKGKFIEVSKTEDFKNSPNPKVQQFIHGEAEAIDIGTRRDR